MGRYEEGKGHRRVKVTLGSASETQAVLRAARNLRGFNEERKEGNQRTVGIDVFLSREELQAKQALRGQWEEACKSKKTGVFWRGARLFVEGKEVHP